MKRKPRQGCEQDSKDDGGPARPIRQTAGKVVVNVNDEVNIDWLRKNRKPKK